MLSPGCFFSGDFVFCVLFLWMRHHVQPWCRREIARVVLNHFFDVKNELGPIVNNFRKVVFSWYCVFSDYFLYQVVIRCHFLVAVHQICYPI